MAGKAISFDESGIAVIARDDGHVCIEFRDEVTQALEGTVKFTADTAIELGKILVTKGVNLRDQMVAANNGATAWSDVEGRVWYGEQGAEQMHPAGADTDMADHSWQEVLANWGPLTPVNA